MGALAAALLKGGSVERVAIGGTGRPAHLRPGYRVALMAVAAVSVAAPMMGAETAAAAGTAAKGDGVGRAAVCAWLPGEVSEARGKVAALQTPENAARLQQAVQRLEKTSAGAALVASARSHGVVMVVASGLLRDNRLYGAYMPEVNAVLIAADGPAADDVHVLAHELGHARGINEGTGAVTGLVDMAHVDRGQAIRQLVREEARMWVLQAEVARDLAEMGFREHLASLRGNPEWRMVDDALGVALAKGGDRVAAVSRAVEALDAKMTASGVYAKMYGDAWDRSRGCRENATERTEAAGVRQAEAVLTAAREGKTPEAAAASGGAGRLAAQWAAEHAAELKGLSAVALHAVAVRLGEAAERMAGRGTTAGPTGVGGGTGSGAGIAGSKGMVARAMVGVLGGSAATGVGGDVVDGAVDGVVRGLVEVWQGDGGNGVERAAAGRELATWIEEAGAQATGRAAELQAAARDAASRMASAQREVEAAGVGLRRGLAGAYRDVETAAGKLNALTRKVGAVEAACQVEAKPGLLGRLRGGVVFGRGERQVAVGSVRVATGALRTWQAARDGARLACAAATSAEAEAAKGAAVVARVREIVAQVAGPGMGQREAVVTVRQATLEGLRGAAPGEVLAAHVPEGVRRLAVAVLALEERGRVAPLVADPIVRYGALMNAAALAAGVGSVAAAEGDQVVGAWTVETAQVASRMAGLAAVTVLATPEGRQQVRDAGIEAAMRATVEGAAVQRAAMVERTPEMEAEVDREPEM